MEIFPYLCSVRTKESGIMTNFKIRTFGRTELAQLYCPELCPQAAFRKLNQWMDLYPNLREELLASGLSPKSRTYTPAAGRADCRGVGRTGRELTSPAAGTFHPSLQPKKTAFHSLNPPSVHSRMLCVAKGATPRC